MMSTTNSLKVPSKNLLRQNELYYYVFNLLIALSTVACTYLTHLLTDFKFSPQFLYIVVHLIRNTQLNKLINF